MKVAIITSSFYPVLDGVTVAVYNRVKELSQLGHEVRVFCPDYSVIKHIYPNWQDYTDWIFPGVKVISLLSTESIGLDFERDVTGKSYKIVERELAKFQPDVIHVDEAERLAVCFLKKPGVKFAQQHNIPCIAFFHTNYLEYFDDYFQLPLGINQIIKRLLSLIFTNIYNTYNLTLVSSQITYQKLAARKVKNLQYSELLGIDLAQFSNIQKSSDFFVRQYKIENIEDKIKLIFVGRLTPDKGWDFGLKTLAKLPLEIRNKIAFIIVGVGDLSDRIKTELSELTPHVYLLGKIDSIRIPNLLTNSDIFVTNSEKETRGLAVIEACAAGIPVIAPNSLGIKDTIIDGENGFLYKSNCQEEFINKLKILITDRDLRKHLGVKAKVKISELSWKQTIENIINIWQQQIDRK